MMRSKRFLGLHCLFLFAVTYFIPLTHCLSLPTPSKDITLHKSNPTPPATTTSPSNPHNNNPNNRRKILTTILLPPSTSLATTDELYLARPIGKSSSAATAPLKYLLPATRVGVYVYRCHSPAEELVAATSTQSQGRTSKAMDDLNRLLITSPPTFINRRDPTTVRKDPYALPPIVGEVAESYVKTKEREENGVDAGTARFFEVGELIGERLTWNRLVRAENAREGSSEIRRALNIYTANIVYDANKYRFAGTLEERKRLIRDDRLSDTVSVIRSDLDARDLYRNAVQTSMDDVVAEFVYQKKILSSKEFDPTELLSLLTTAKTNIDKWFSFIPDDDVGRAIAVIEAELGLSQFFPGVACCQIY